MSNNNLPTGWGNQPSNAPKGWGEIPEQKKNNPFSPVATEEENENKEPEPIAEQSDNIIKDDTDDIVPAEQEADAAEYNDSFDTTVSQKDTEKRINLNLRHKQRKRNQKQSEHQPLYL